MASVRLEVQKQSIFCEYTSLRIVQYICSSLNCIPLPRTINLIGDRSSACISTSCVRISCPVRPVRHVSVFVLYTHCMRSSVLRSHRSEPPNPRAPLLHRSLPLLRTCQSVRTGHLMQQAASPSRSRVHFAFCIPLHTTVLCRTYCFAHRRRFSHRFRAAGECYSASNSSMQISFFLLFSLPLLVAKNTFCIKHSGSDSNTASSEHLSHRVKAIIQID